MRARTLAWLLVLVAAVAPSARAHTQSTAFIRIADTLRLDVALVDLEQAVGLDANGDGQVTWGELRAAQPRIEGYVRPRMALTAADGQAAACDLGAPQLLVDDHVDGSYAVLQYAPACLANGTATAIRYDLLFDRNASHRVLLSRSRGDEVVDTAVLTADARTLKFDGADAGGAPDARPRWFSWLSQGALHIWGGFDHLLFLATLLLPAIVRRRDGAWIPSASLNATLAEVFKVVTAFTVAHSLTLALGALQVVRIPSRIVETAIALTVLFGAVNVVLPMVQRRIWLLAGAFGLVHGLGFAASLADLGLDRRHLVADLLAFNLGVEVGQLAVVALFVPIAFVLRRRTWYQRIATPGAAAAIGLVACAWAVQRATLG